MKTYLKKILKILRRPWRIFHLVRIQLFHLFGNPTLNDGERFDPKIFRLFGLREAGSLARYQFAQQIIGTTGEILDIACGTGYGTLLLSDNCQRITGVDTEQSAIDFARRKYRRSAKIDFIRADLMHYQAPADVVVSLETIEHLVEPLETVVNQLLENCRHKLIISVPYQEPPGHNKHHRKFRLSEADFAFLASSGTLNFYYQSPAGLITKDRGRETETLILVWERIPGQDQAKENAAPKISVIIPNLNGAHFLKTCLQSLRAQDFPGFEVIIIDNGSDDNSLAIAQTEYPAAITYEFSENVGFSRAINKGLSLARGRYIFLLNNDTELAPGCLNNLYDCLERDPRISCAAAKMLYFENRTHLNDAGNLLSIYGLAFKRGQGEVDRGQYDRVEPIFGACAGGAMYRREVLDRLGGLAEDFFAYLEDVDLSFRANLLGYRTYFLPTAVIYHVDGGTSRKEKTPVHFLMIRNSLYLIYRNYPPALLFWLAPFIALAQIRNLISSYRHHCGPELIKAYRDFYHALPRLRRERREIQRTRLISARQVLKLLSKKYPFPLKNLLYGFFFHHR